MEIRDCVMQFARQMEKNLIKHDKDRGERGWLNCSIQELIERIEGETRELEQAHTDHVTKKESWAGVMKEAADVANFAMMIHDIAKRNFLA